MSLAENLLNSLDASARLSSEEEAHIVVGEDRIIRVPNELKLIAVKGDKDIETVTIDCVRYWDGYDLSSFAIYINYTLPNGEEATYIPNKIKASDDIFSFDWTIGEEITNYVGRLTFWIVAKRTNSDGVLEKQWSSLKNSEMTIADGGTEIFTPETQTEIDILTQALQTANTSLQKVYDFINKYQPENWRFTLEDGTVVTKTILVAKFILFSITISSKDYFNITEEVDVGTTWAEWCEEYNSNLHPDYIENLGTVWSNNGGYVYYENVGNHLSYGYLADSNGNKVLWDSEIIGGDYT